MLAIRGIWINHFSIFKFFVRIEMTIPKAIVITIKDMERISIPNNKSGDATFIIPLYV